VRTKLALVLAALTFVAGCGGGGEDRLTKAEFEQRIQADGKTLQDAISGVSGSSSLAELATQVAVAEKAVKSAADDLDELAPPEEAEAPTDVIVKALRTIDEQLRQLEQAAKDKDLLAVQKAANAIQASTAIKAAQKAANELKAKGYKIGVLGS
jgi:hypothetical protein